MSILQFGKWGTCHKQHAEQNAHRHTRVLVCDNHCLSYQHVPCAAQLHTLWRCTAIVIGSRWTQCPFVQCWFFAPWSRRTSNSAGFTAEAVPAHAMPVLCNWIWNETTIHEASISLVTRPYHTNGTIDSAGFAAKAVPACVMPVLWIGLGILFG